MDNSIGKSFAQMLKEYFVIDELQTISRTPLGDLIDNQLTRRIPIPVHIDYSPLISEQQMQGRINRFAHDTTEITKLWDPYADEMKNIILEILKLTTVHANEMKTKDQSAWNKITELCNKGLDIK